MSFCLIYTKITTGSIGFVIVFGDNEQKKYFVFPFID